jgi:hypothetical protein
MENIEEDCAEKKETSTMLRRKLSLKQEKFITHKTVEFT